MNIATLKAFALIGSALISIARAQLLDEPTVEPERGWFDKPIKVSLTADEKKAVIYYTLDGSIPSDTNGSIYKAPILIEGASVLRSRAYLSEKVFSNVNSHTYLIESSILSQSDSIDGWPRPLLATGYGNSLLKFDYEMDPEIVQHEAYKEDIIKGLYSIPAICLSMKKEDFWQMTLRNDELPVSIELIYPDGKTEQIDGGIEGMSHKHMKRNYRLSFKKKYGKGKFKSDIFKDYAPLHGKSAAKEFDQIVLRAGTQRSWARDDLPDRTAFTRDQWYRDTQLAMSDASPRGTFMHLFVNGVYFGMYNVTERPDEKFLSSYFGGDDEHWFCMNHNGTLEGDEIRYNYLMDSILIKDLSRPDAYEEFTTYLDVPNFCDYVLLGWFIGMSDWPENNYYAGARVVDPTPLRFLGWDAELSWDDKKDSHPGAHVHPAFLPGEEAYSPIPQIWQAAIKQPDFLMAFTDRVYLHGLKNGALTDEACKERWNILNNYISEAVVVESARWGDVLEDSITRTRDDQWASEIVRVENMMNGNMDRFLLALREVGYYPAIDPPFWKEPMDNMWEITQFDASKAQGINIYYRLDGGDPRDSGGDIHIEAKLYEGPVKLPDSCMISARALKDSVWSALYQTSYGINIVEKK